MKILNVKKEQMSSKGENNKSNNLFKASDFKHRKQNLGMENGILFSLSFSPREIIKGN